MFSHYSHPKKRTMTNTFVFVLISCSFFGNAVCGIIQKKTDPEKCVNITKIESYGLRPYVVVQTYSILKGHCGCFDYTGEVITYNPAKICQSILLCRMLYNIAIMQNLHFKMIPSFQAQSKLYEVKPSDGFAVKVQNTEHHVIQSPKAINTSTSCLSKLLQKEVPFLLIKLHDLLCLFQKGKDEHNEALYKEFLVQLNTVLKDAGCSLDEVLNTKNILEQITDNAGKIADRVVFEILKIADDLELTGQLLNVVCKLLGKTLVNLSNSLSGLNRNLDLGVKKIAGKLLG